MPLLSRAASMGARALGWGSGYAKAPMIRTGSTGNITNVGSGYTLDSFDDATFAYLNAGKTDGQWYWEAVSIDFNMYGITTTPSTNRTWAGYSTANAGIYTFGGQFWNQWGTVPSAAGNVNPGSVLGFALDVPGKTLAIYKNNTLLDTLPLTSISGAIYPIFGFQTATGTSTIRLGPGACQYSPPSGYRHI